MKIILGLGNPGPEYAHTRHNVGFMTADLLARRHRVRIDVRRNQSRLGEGRIGDEEIVIAKPQTYMNESGNAVLSLLARYRVQPGDLIVICDDMNLEVGMVRVRASGSAGGHNGLKSIIGRIGTTEFPRVRIGVGRAPEGAWIDHVLGEFAPSERQAITDAVERAADAVEMILQAGAEVAASRFNRKSVPSEEPPS